MPHYSGITSDLAARKAQHQHNPGFHPNLRNWTVENGGESFPSRVDAQAWEDRQPGEHHPGGAPVTGPWYGYSFDY